MKYLIASVALIGLLFSCSEDEPTTTADGKEINFSIEGTISGAENDSIFVEALSAEGTISIGSTKLDEEGHFKISNNIPGFGLYQLRITGGDNMSIPLTLVPNDNLTVKGSKDEFTTKTELSGTEWAPVLAEYMVLFNEFMLGQQGLMQKQGTISDEQLMAEYIEMKSKVDDYAIKNIKNDPGNPANIILSTSLEPVGSFEGYNPENVELFKSLASAFNSKFPSSPLSKKLSDKAFQLEGAYNNYVADNSGNRVAPEITLEQPNGKMLSLSSLRGQYVLIDFWASWCKPCRQENPNVVRLYNTYKDKGFTILSVSLDQDKDAWLKAINADGLIWPNHVSDLLQWQSPMVQLYGISGIPHTVLVGPEGKIIGTGLRGAKLEQKLNEIFNS